MLTIIGIALIVYAMYYFYAHAQKKDPGKNAEAINRIPPVTIIPTPINTLGQVMNLAGNASILTYFHFENGFVTMKFKNGYEFSEHLSNCVFQFDINKYGQRRVYPKNNNYFTVLEVDGIGLKKQEWDAIFFILKHAGTIYGSH